MTNEEKPVMPKQVSLSKKEEVEVKVYLDITDPENIVALDKEEESLLDKANLPENIFEFTSQWAKPTYMLNTIIEMNSQANKAINGKVQTVFDANLYSMAQIMVLLRSWNLEKLDPQYKLISEISIDTADVKILTAPMLKKIGDIQPPTVVSMMYSNAMEKIYVNKESEVVKKLREAKKE